MKKVFIIAELGVNHNGSLDLALKIAYVQMLDPARRSCDPYFYFHISLKHGMDRV